MILYLHKKRVIYEMYLYSNLSFCIIEKKKKEREGGREREGEREKETEIETETDRQTKI